MNNTENFFSKLEQSLKEIYEIDSNFIKKYKESYSYDITELGIKAEDILNELESKHILLDNNKFKSIKDLDANLKDIFKNEIIKKNNDPKRKAVKNRNDYQTYSNSKLDSSLILSSSQVGNSSSLSLSKIINNQNFSNRNYSFTNIVNQYNGSLSNEVPTKLNTSNISINLYQELETKEYSIGAKNNNEYLEGIKRYYKKFSDAIKEEYKEILFDSSSGNYIFLVSFKNSDLSYESIIFIDPYSNWNKYKVCFDECENIKSDSLFHEGQIIITHGKIQGSVYHPLSITLGMPLVQYNILESSLVNIYKEHLPYMINILYGPFFKSDSIDITLFSRTLKNISENNPHCLIIGGPFLSIENSLFQKGEIFLMTNTNNTYFATGKPDEQSKVSLSYIEYFHLLIEKIEEIFLNTRTHIVLIPSVKDIVNIYPIPQPKYNMTLLNMDKYELYKKRRMSLIGNPQIIKINEVIFGVTNYEMIDEILSNSIKSTRQSNIDQVLDSILKQTSFLPVLPIKKENDQSNILLEYREYSNLLIDTIPDVYITPFKNIPLAKKSNSSLFINPISAITKSKHGETLGSYINMYVYPNNKLVGTSIMNRIRVDRVIIEES